MRDSAVILTAVPALAALLILGVAFAKPDSAATPRIQILPNESARRVDVVIDGKPFTSYIWPDNLAKPVLYPLRAADGTVVTRGFPLDPRPGERVDHPHHVGLWFNYGNVNDFDFWNNSYAIKKEDAHKMGNVVQRKIVSAKSGTEKGELTVETDWISGTQKLLLKEHTQLIFSGDKTSRTIDRITTLQAQNEKVVFHDDKEGMLGMRVTRALEMPSTTAEVFTDANGNPTAVAKLDNTGVNGNYLTSEGKKADEAWSTRGKWCMLSGKVGDDPAVPSRFSIIPKIQTSQPIGMRAVYAPSSPPTRLDAASSPTARSSRSTLHARAQRKRHLPLSRRHIFRNCFAADCGRGVPEVRVGLSLRANGGPRRGMSW